MRTLSLECVYIFSVGFLTPQVCWTSSPADGQNHAVPDARTHIYLANEFDLPHNPVYIMWTAHLDQSQFIFLDQSYCTFVIFLEFRWHDLLWTFLFPLGSFPVDRVVASIYQIAYVVYAHWKASNPPGTNFINRASHQYHYTQCHLS